MKKNVIKKETHNDYKLWRLCSTITEKLNCQISEIKIHYLNIFLDVVD